MGSHKGRGTENISDQGGNRTHDLRIMITVPQPAEVKVKVHVI